MVTSVEVCVSGYTNTNTIKLLKVYILQVVESKRETQIVVKKNFAKKKLKEFVKNKITSYLIITFLFHFLRIVRKMREVNKLTKKLINKVIPIKKHYQLISSLRSTAN